MEDPIESYGPILKKLIPPDIKPLMGAMDFEQTIDSSEIKDFHVDFSNVHLLILGGEAGKASIKIQWLKKKSNFNPHISFKLEENTLVLQDKGDPSNHEIAKFVKRLKPCHIMVTLPPLIDMKINIRMGSIYIDKMASGYLRVSIKKGHIKGNIFTKDLNVKLETGNVKLHHLQGSAEVSTKLGNIELLFDEINLDNRIGVVSKTGNINIRFPFGFLKNNLKKKRGEIENAIGASVFVTNKFGRIKLDTAFFKPLPVEILLTIFNYLYVADLVRVSKVCKSWHEVANHDSLWKTMAEVYKSNEKKHPKRAHETWKNYYKRHSIAFFKTPSDKNTIKENSSIYFNQVVNSFPPDIYELASTVIHL
jgi:hypothetical protein